MLDCQESLGQLDNACLLSVNEGVQALECSYSQTLPVYTSRMRGFCGLSQAVFETVLPRQSGDAIPRTSAGILVSVADRLDSLVGLWAAGEAPRSSADPFGLRRSAYGMLQV